MHTVTMIWFRTHLEHLAARLDPGPTAQSEQRRLHGDAGAVSTELVIIIAGLATLALAVVAIIALKVNDKAESIPTS